MSKDHFYAKVTVVSNGGSPVQREVSVVKTGATVGDVLKQAGISPEKKNIFVNGKPATLETFFRPEDTLKVEERPQGS